MMLNQKLIKTQKPKDHLGFSKLLDQKLKKRKENQCILHAFLVLDAACG